MPGWEPTVAGNTRSQQRQIDKIGTARMGPVSIGPGDGHIRYYDDSGRTTFRTDSAGAQVWAHDALRPMGGLIESKASQTYVDGNISTLVARDNDLQADINTRATRTYVDGNIATVVSRLNGHDSALAAQSGRITTAQARADSAHSRAGTGISNAATAQSRADSAYTRAGTGISNAATAQARANTAVSDAAAARARADDAIDRATALRTAVLQWISDARRDVPGLPPWPGG